jgi:transcriptional regulator with XRE-family HTH domain
MERLAQQFLRAIRGNRSQVALSRRLGFASRVAAEWESGRRVPSAETALLACARTGIDVSSAFARFNAATGELIEVRGTGRRATIDPKGIAAWLRAHRSRTRGSEISKRTGLSRSKLSRIFSGVSGVRLTDFFAIVQATTGRLTDLIAALVDVTAVPDAAAIHVRVEASRALAFAEPWTSAVLALLEVRAYHSSRQDSVAFLAQRLHIAPSVVERCLDKLSSAGLIQKRRGKYRILQALTVDTRDPERASLLQRHWAAASTARLAAPKARDLFAYNVFSVSQADFGRIRELQKQYFRELRAIVAGSEPVETAALLTVHLVDFGETEALTR